MVAELKRLCGFYMPILNPSACAELIDVNKILHNDIDPYRNKRLRATVSKFIEAASVGYTTKLLK